MDTANEEPVIPTESLVEQHRKTLTKKFKEETIAAKDTTFKKRIGEGNIDLDAKKLKLALEKEKSGVEQKNKYDVTEEELEAYRMLNRRSEDPMANYTK